MSDELAERMLEGRNLAEVLEWLRGGPGRTLGELSTSSESIQLAKDIYASGAVTVTAVEIEEYPEGQNSGHLVVTLPDEAESRRRVFEWNSQNARRLGFEPDEDIGQRYLFVLLD